MNNQPNASREWFGLIETYKQRNLTQKEFCKRNSLALCRFMYYLQRYRKQQKSLSSQKPAFSQVIV